MTTSETSGADRLVAAEQRARIALATAVAIFVAGVLLVTVILPSEYGVDPAGTGRLLGLTAMGQAAAGESGATATSGTPLEPVRPGANTAQSVGLKQDTVSFEIGAREGIEYKYRMQQSASFLYAWQATGRVSFDFHGEPEGAPQGYAESYQMGEGMNASGSFFAPTAGIHGWYWENLTDAPITVTLKSTGFYAGATEFRRSGRTQHEVQDR